MLVLVQYLKAVHVNILYPCPPTRWLSLCCLTPENDSHTRSVNLYYGRHLGPVHSERLCLRKRHWQKECWSRSRHWKYIGINPVKIIAQEILICGNIVAHYERAHRLLINVTEIKWFVQRITLSACNTLQYQCSGNSTKWHQRLVIPIRASSLQKFGFWEYPFIVTQFCVQTAMKHTHTHDTVRGMSRLLGNAMSALVLAFALA